MIKMNSALSWCSTIWFIPRCLLGYHVRMIPKGLLGKREQGTFDKLISRWRCWGGCDMIPDLSWKMMDINAKPQTKEITVHISSITLWFHHLQLMKLKPIALAIRAACLHECDDRSQTTSTFDEHKHLYNTIQAHGVTIKINDPRECNKGIDGSTLVMWKIPYICQDNDCHCVAPEIDWPAQWLWIPWAWMMPIIMVQDCVLNGWVIAN